MSNATLPVSRLISVTVNLNPKATANQNLSTLLILGPSDVIDVNERMREYDGIDGVASDFGTSAPEYKAAALWFEQAPQPATVLIGRWAETATHGKLVCGPLTASQQAMSAWTVITNGGFKVTIDGESSPQALTGLSFAGQTNLNGVASVINGALSGASIAWDSNYDRFVLTSTTTGVSSSVSFLTPPNSGTDISGLLAGLSTSSGAYVANGLAPEQAVDAVALFDSEFGQKWYAVSVLGLTPGSGSDSSHLLDVSDFVEATDTKHLHGITTQEGGVLVAATTSDIAYAAKQAAYKRTLTQYSGSSPHAVCSALGRLLTVDFNGNSTAITLAYKQEPGIVPEKLNTTQVNSCVAKHCLVIVEYNNDAAIIEPASAVMASGDYCDDITDTDWLATAIMTACFNLLYQTPTKIAQTNKGMHVITTTIENVCSQGVANGVLAPGKWDEAGFGSLNQGDFLERGFYVFAPPVEDQNSSDRSARKSVSFQVAAKLAGAVHTVSVAINVNR